ncbi:hypothetical protein NEOLEDRAFT_1066131 [Neolentinus lepideus HHB14362 ss-1]|uniref:Integral membrane protein n=1 Tax=Neolentinus lepideus HHB14362 ss-1 TaxID=1314782 RepID=A0A165SEJ3_9AGAM|nr:hypothetical protein NEOLEDRAFT_1066131 [Neolentinus lepideus HHB14362 ss-1]
MSKTADFVHELHPAVKRIPGSERSALPSVKATHAKLVDADQPDVHYEWRSRDHRKARHQVYAPNSAKTNRRTAGWKKLGRMLVLEYWNISWWIAVLFTLGSVVWCVNGFIVFLPFVYSSVETNTVAGGWTAWVGATIFTAASLLLIWEAWNRSNTVYFGWGIEQVLQHRPVDVEQAGTYSDWAEIDHSDDTSGPAPPGQRKWIWWTTDTKYWRELGFLAGFVQLCAATIFWISGFTALPEVQDAILDNTPLLNGVFWSPQVVGGSGFIISSALYMFETQTKWYRPAITNLGWQIGFWNFIGGIGFTLCGAFGYSTRHWAQYQSTLSTFWGSWSFLIGSVMQWYEAVNAVEPIVPSQGGNGKAA